MLEYFEKKLQEKIEEYKDNKYYEIIKYSLSSGGKRIRPMLVLNLAKSLNLDYERVVDLAIAIEFIHNYSLVHDDLPCMDNDTYRRGNLTVHKKFGEYKAVLVGDLLLTEAFYIIASSKTLINKAEIIKILSNRVGANGMLLGQLLDMEYENKKISKEILELIHKKKTADLIIACFLTTLKEFFIDDKKYLRIASNLGLVYQLQDDIFDADNKEDKSNFANILGIETLKKVLNEKIYEIREDLKENPQFLEYIEKILIRKY